MQSSAVHIKIPRQLATKVAQCTDTRAAIETWLYLRTLCTAGRFENVPCTRKYWARKCRVSYGTFKGRLLMLEQLGLSWTFKGYQYYASLQQVKEKFNLPAKTRYYYVPLPPAGDLKLEDILDEIYLYEIHVKCNAAYDFYLGLYPDVKKTLRRVLGSSRRATVQQGQLDVFLSNYIVNGVKLDDDDILDLAVVRADLSMNYQTLSHYFMYSGSVGTKYTGALHYKLKRLERLGRIKVVRERKYVLEHHPRRKDRQWAQGGLIKSDPRVNGRPVLTMPNKIFFNSAYLNAALCA